MGKGDDKITRTSPRSAAWAAVTRTIPLEPSRPAHLLELSFGVGVAPWSRAEHHEGEHGWEWRRDSIFVRDELDREHVPASSEAAARFPQQTLAGLMVEMVEEVREQDEIVCRTPLDLKSISRNGLVAISD